MKLRMSIFLGAIVLSYTWCQAQDYDDIYYDSSKHKKAEKVTKSNEQTYYYDDSYASQPVDYSHNMTARDVDEYNRRGDYSAETDSVSANDSLSMDANGENFVYTDRIKRFHNPDVIVESGDEVANVYYIATAPSVELVIGTPSYYGGWGGYSTWDDWGYPYGYSRYSWYDSYYSWGPMWHSPYYYGGWYGCYGPSWSWYYPSWGGHYHGSCRPGGIGGHRPAVAQGGRRPFGGSNYGSAGSGRPGYNTGASRTSGSRRSFGSVSGRDNGGTSVGRRPNTGTGTTGQQPASSGRRPFSKNNNTSVDSRTHSTTEVGEMQMDGGRTTRQSTNSNYNNSNSRSNSSSGRSSFGGSRSSGSFGGGSSSRGGGSSHSSGRRP